MKALSVSMTVAVLAATFSVPVSAQERRTVPVTVVYKDGKIVEGLTAANFRGKFRGKPVHFESADVASEPIRVLLFLDVSPSMKRKGLERARDFIPAFITAENPRTEIGLAIFAIEWKMVQPKTTRYDSLLTALRQVSDIKAGYFGDRNGAHTKINKSIRGYVEDAAQYGDVIVLITDGRIDTWEFSWKGTTPTLLAKGIRLYIVDVGEWIKSVREIQRSHDGPDRVLISPGGHTREDALKIAPKETGGELVLLEKRGDYRKFKSPTHVAVDLRRLIENTYLLDFTPDRPIDKKSKWKLKVVDASGKKMKGVKVHYPRYLVPREAGQ